MRRTAQGLGWLAAIGIVPLMVAQGRAGLESMSPLADGSATAVSAIAAWPLAALVALALTRAAPRLARRLLAVVALGLAAGLLWQLPALGEFAGHLSEANRAGWAARFALRGAICFVVEVLWLMAILGWTPEAAIGRPPAWAWAGALLAAGLIPPAQAGYRATAQLDRAAEHLAAGRWMQARRELARLEQIGVWRTFRGVDVRTAGAELDREIVRLAQHCARPLPEDCSVETRIDRARGLAQLDFTGPALVVLDPVRYASMDASSLAGAILQQRGAYSASDAAYRRALALAPHEPPTSDAERARIERAYNALAFNARARERSDLVPAIYEQARAQYPQLAAAFDEQLGRHYHARGRPQLAQRHFEAAAQADPKRFGNWSRTLAAKLDFHGLLTLCSLGGGHGASPGQVGSMQAVAEEAARE